MPIPRAAMLLLMGCAALAACGSTSSTPTLSATVGVAGGQPAADPLAQTGLTVFAAASLTQAFSDARIRLQSEHAGLSITDSFAGSQTLVSHVQNGAPADVIATADTATMQTLVTAGLVDAPQTFARNRLEIVVAAGNPKAITGLADLGRSDLKVVLADPSVPAGKYGRQALQAQGVTVHPVSQPLDVKSELLAVQQGNADAGIVYVTDVSAAGSSVTGVTIPDSQNIIAVYPIAVVRATRHLAAAEAFVADALHGDVQKALLARGFIGP